MEGLEFDNILGEEQVADLFSNAEDTTESSNDNDNTDKETKEQEQTTEVNTDDLFDEKPESVSSEDKKGEEESTTSEKDNATSPNNFYSSIAKALKDDGIFPDLEDDVLSKIKNPDEFHNVMEQQINLRLDERQRRISEALDANVASTDIQKYEQTIGYLNSIQDDKIKDEGEAGENLRKQLIFQDYINRGYSKERAEREVTKSFNAGSDVDDALDALKGNLEYFQDEYKLLIEEGKQQEKAHLENLQKQSEELKKSLLDEKEIFGMSLDKKVRQQIYDNVSKPIYKDPKTGSLYTAIQKYEKDNKSDFLKNVGLLFTLTDGFTNMDKLIKTEVSKGVKKGISNLEKALNNTSRDSDGTLNFMRGVSGDTESYFSKGYDLDI